VPGNGPTDGDSSSSVFTFLPAGKYSTAELSSKLCFAYNHSAQKTTLLLLRGCMLKVLPSNGRSSHSRHLATGLRAAICMKTLEEDFHIDIITLHVQRILRLPIYIWLPLSLSWKGKKFSQFHWRCLKYLAVLEFLEISGNDKSLNQVLENAVLLFSLSVSQVLIFLHIIAEGLQPKKETWNRWASIFLRTFHNMQCIMLVCGAESFLRSS
jgi:hypothetical protein